MRIIWVSLTKEGQSAKRPSVLKHKQITTTQELNLKYKTKRIPNKWVCSKCRCHPKVGPNSGKCPAIGSGCKHWHRKRIRNEVMAIKNECESETIWYSYYKFNISSKNQPISAHDTLRSCWPWTDRELIQNTWLWERNNFQHATCVAKISQKSHLLLRLWNYVDYHPNHMVSYLHNTVHIRYNVSTKCNADKYVWWHVYFFMYVIIRHDRGGPKNFALSNNSFKYSCLRQK